MSYSINGRRFLLQPQLPINRQAINRPRFSQNNTGVNHPTQTKDPQVNTNRTRSMEVVKTPLSQLLRNDILNAGQKNNFHNLTAFLNVILTDKFSDLLRNNTHEANPENPPVSEFFNLADSDNGKSFFTKDEIITFVAETGICESGLEEKFVDALIETSTPRKTNFRDEENTYEFTLPTKHLLQEWEVEERPNKLQEIAKLLEHMQRAPHAVSDEQKKLLLQKLKETDEKDELEGFDFDYMEISKIDN